MSIHRLFFTSLILFTFFFISFPCLADVEDIIGSQAELRKSEAENNNRNPAENSKNAALLGQQEFTNTCAICHGNSGKGDGPFSSRLAKKPKDLTQIRSNNNGMFPFKRLYEIIDGREGAGTHGSRTMPIWGDRYSAESWFKVSTEHAETLARGKILELLLYIESIQDN